MDYDLEIEKVKKEIKKVKAKRVCLQLPDGLKPKAMEISKQLEKTGAKIYIWSGTNFGGCDLPFYLDKYDFDLLINFGHARFKR